jgi:hypothetical protein
MSKKRKPSRKQKPSFKTPASPNVASANKPSEKTQPSLKTPNVTRGSESQPPPPPSPSLAKRKLPWAPQHQSARSRFDFESVRAIRQPVLSRQHQQSIRGR